MKASNDMWNKVFKKNEQVVSREIAGERLLVPIRGKLADMQSIFVLNPIAEYIWQHLDGGHTLEEICDGILSRFKVGKEEAESDLMEFIDRLREAKLIQG